MTARPAATVTIIGALLLLLSTFLPRVRAEAGEDVFQTYYQADGPPSGLDELPAVDAWFFTVPAAGTLLLTLAALAVALIAALRSDLQGRVASSALRLAVGCWPDRRRTRSLAGAGQAWSSQVHATAIERHTKVSQWTNRRWPISIPRTTMLRDAVSLVVRELMGAEVAQLTGAGRGERDAGRVTQLNGYRQRAWETRVGEIELAIPRTRSGPS